jgi:hypothetical protein
MSQLYFYNNQVIQKTDCGKGWYIYNENNLTHIIYKTLDDARNSLDKEYGNRTCIIPKRADKPIKIIGKMTFKLDKNDQGYYEYEWY